MPGGDEELVDLVACRGKLGIGGSERLRVGARPVAQVEPAVPELEPTLGTVDHEPSRRAQLLDQALARDRAAESRESLTSRGSLLEALGAREVTHPRFERLEQECGL